MKPIHVNELTSAAFQEDVLRQRLPEFYDLKNTVENNAWHQQQTVFNHCVRVLWSLQGIWREIADKTYIDHSTSVALRYYLQETTRLDRQSCMTYGCVLHDIAKPATLVTDVDGHTSCPGHDVVGGLQVQNFVDRFSFGRERLQYVEQFVRNHEIALRVLMWGDEHKVPIGDSVRYLHRVTGGIHIDLMIHQDADIRGCAAKPGLAESAQRLLWGALKEACQQIGGQP